MISFEYPIAFWFILFFVLLEIFFRSKPRSIYFPNAHILQKSKLKWLNLKNLLKWITLISLVFALASPVIYDNFYQDKKKGINIVLAIDVSGSMARSFRVNGDIFSANFFENLQENDPSKSKFTISKKIIENFVQKRPHDNIGITAFGRFGFVVCPLTFDKKLLEKMLKNVSIKPSVAGGTAIGEGIARAVGLLAKTKSKSKIIILVTDGIEEGQVKVNIAEATAIAKKNGIKVYTIGIGSNGVFNRRDLELISHETGAKSYNASNPKELESIYNTINKLEKSQIKSNAYKYKKYYFFYPLLLAFFAGTFFVFLLRRDLD